MRSREFKAENVYKGIEGDNLPLCYASFELIRHMIRASKQKKRRREDGAVQKPVCKWR